MQAAGVAVRAGLVAIGQDDGIIQILRIVDKKLIHCTALEGHGVKNQIGVRCVQFGHSGELISCAGDGTIRVWR